MWDQIKSNRMRSAVLVMFMCLLLLGLGYVIGLFFLDSIIGGLAIAAVIWAVMSLVAFFQGDNILLSIAGARKVSKSDDPQLYNIVEEMTIASGLPKMPDVYIVNDKALNAFATGRNPEKAAVTVTSGLRAALNRDELQGVVAHEIGHIKNRDVLLMTITSVMLGAIVIISWYATRVMFLTGGGRSNNNRNSAGPQAILMIIGLVLMILAPLFAQLIYFAISRKREYLADASAALYTRYPEGLASALEKLGSSVTPVKAANKATAPMYIINPFAKRNAINSWMSTHPPIADRARILRSMSGSSLADYENAYGRTHDGKHILPKSERV
ncbi:MAG: M48 family metallopeptidase [Dehalococcoidia bacterium]|nr:M48 family metallopeptidase [Dehalococcoidia bacterium]